MIHKSLFKKITYIKQCPFCNSEEIYFDESHCETLCYTCGTVFKDATHSYVDLDKAYKNKKKKKEKIFMDNDMCIVLKPLDVELEPLDIPIFKPLDVELEPINIEFKTLS